MKRVLTVILCIMIVFSFILSAYGLQSVPVTGIKVDSSNISLEVGKTYSIKVVFTPANTTQRLLKYSTSNKNVAAIDAQGNIKAVGAGTAVITVASTVNAAAAATCKVTVSKKMDFSKHTNYSWWTKSNKYAFYSGYGNNPVVWYLAKKFNMTFNFQEPAQGTETNALSIMMATGDYSDIVYISEYSGSKSQLYKDGAILNIADYLQYMPNLKTLIDSDPGYRKNLYNDDGQILTLPAIGNSRQKPWGGLVYRYDILKTVTKNNVVFPSGKDVPTTVQDWDYMLPLFKKYFEQENVKDFAPFILPATGTFAYSDLLSGFGGYASSYLFNGKVRSGTTSGEYNYLLKMKEWYDKGLIYKDFASRTNDPFYFPNTALTYGGKAGVWYGLTSQLGSALGEGMDVRAIPSPLDTAHGIKTAPNFAGSEKTEQTGLAIVITKKCKNVEKLLAALDYLYGQEGSMVVSYGLDADKAEGNPVYEKIGLKNGVWTMGKNGEFSYTKELMANKDAIKEWDSLYGNRLPGWIDYTKPLPTETPTALEAYKIWNTYSTVGIKLPSALARTAEEDAVYVKNTVRLRDYTNSTLVKFILGGMELNQNTWNNYIVQLNKYGLEENIKIEQASLARYNKR